MMVLVSYDVNTEDRQGQKRLRKIAKLCQNWGQRVQYSVFECLVDPAQWTALRAALIDCMDEEKDSLRFYFLGANWNMSAPKPPSIRKGRSYSEKRLPGKGGKNKNGKTGTSSSQTFPSEILAGVTD